ncbi:hypothetical protein AKJ51_00585 [candidate division MSBL1 archaeon SCGC-AAA382A20]|uniref:HEPN domain-containing protein n=1 Tax=candidate division MSBL1 archaeon SCGC-AAA382A20 TaxID=1698280 RepID=A0A133VMI7_9EURY|nr:hypothetical protein AKJ51_00585 [candidate division MSBL1 archaeon SCGC-AAA382A20]
MKSLIIEKEDKFPKIHDLVSLGRQVNVPNQLLEVCKKITPAYPYARYPDVIESPELEKKIKDFIARTREVLEWVEGKI